MNTATLTAPVRTIFREMPLALPEPMDSQLTRAGFLPWMLTAAWQEHIAAVHRLGQVKAYALMRAALRDVSPTHGIGEFLWDTEATEVRDYGSTSAGRRCVISEKKSLWRMIEERRDFLAKSIADDLVAKAARQARARAFNRKLKRLSA